MPVWRPGTTRDIANAAAFLLSGEASWITGVIPAGGGALQRRGP